MGECWDTGESIAKENGKLNGNWGYIGVYIGLQVRGMRRA